MEYGRLGAPEPTSGGTSTRSLTPDPTRAPKKSRLKLLLLLAATLLAASAVAASLVALVVRNRVDDSSRASSALHARRPSKAISYACGRTRYPTLCVNSLLDFPGAASASGKDLVHISVNMTLRKFGRALYSVAEISNLKMDPRVRSAYDDCLELLDDSVDLLARSLTTVAPAGSSGGGSTQDVLTWLSASLTNQDTCTDGFSELSGYVKNQMTDRLKDLSELVSNCLAIYAAASGDEDFSGIPIQNRRRRLLGGEKAHKHFPAWLSRRDRKLLDLPVTAMNADIVVSHDGNGTYKTITEAIKKAPEYSSRRFIIYVRAGRYEETILKVGRKKTNIIFIGDGKGKTVISTGKSIQDNMTTFHTAGFAATGTGFIARDITFENWAGPSKHQAVALRVGADHAVIYRCNVIGYQDTLYAHSQRQFYRECDIYGTVDFIFGNAAVVFQNCSIHARKPLPGQKNTITAQNRKDPNQNTGISIHACRIIAEPDLEAAKGAYPTYLGRPWKLYSRTVYLQSYIGDHIHPRGWLEWNATFALDTLYYGEYMNYGPGGAIGQRVKWPGYRVITAVEEASKFTVAQFIYGSSWLPSTGVAFLAGLST
ncbi:probable pectinesterase/pectinesterase inhibitor 34 [Salvia splendens]|uniref:probable pectinesterase/pectinesterase inhibitor 34 n=1 Tax=Salvia splendens TaxID=180675 RepID=UPI001C2668C3|nr:probable pectinesterase/pectinesterase inhibitor 34 [Salvia splendens]